MNYSLYGMSKSSMQIDRVVKLGDKKMEQRFNADLFNFTKFYKEKVEKVDTDLKSQAGSSA